MPTPRRSLPLFVLLLVLAFALTGCIHLDRSMQLNSDGTGTFTVSFGFADKLINLAGTSFVSQMNACGDKVKAQGGSYQRTDTGGYSAWSFIWPFKSIDRLNELLALNTSFCPVPNTTVPATAASTDSFSVTSQTHFLSTTFVITGHLSFQLPSEVTNSPDPNVIALLKEAHSTFAVTMPGYISSHTGVGTVSGNTVTYTAHVGDTLDFQIVGGGVNTSALLLLGGGGLLLLGGLIVVDRSLRQSLARRMQAAEAVISAALTTRPTPAPPVATPAEIRDLTKGAQYTQGAPGTQQTPGSILPPLS